MFAIGKRMRRNRSIRRATRSVARTGIAAIEVVLTTALILPSLFYLLYLGFQVCRNFFSLVGAMVGSPF